MLALVLTACTGPGTRRVSVEEMVSPTAPRQPAVTPVPAAASGASPRFVVTARTPLTRFPDGGKNAEFTPVPPAVHDAATGAFVAEIPLPEGAPSSWRLLAAARDNRTFLLSGWTGPGSPLVFFRVRLAEDGTPGEPEAVPGPAPADAARGLPHAVALSPDGTRVAYAMTVVGAVKVTVVDTATGERRDWTAPPGAPAYGLAWSPDGRRLALASGPRGLRVLDTEDPGADLLAASTRVAPAGNLLVSSVGFTPGGEALIYSDGHTVKRVAVDGRTPPATLAEVSLPRDASASLRFSLDAGGRHLLYTHGWRLFRLDLAGGTTASAPIAGGERPGEGDTPVAAW